MAEKGASSAVQQRQLQARQALLSREGSKELSSPDRAIAARAGWAQPSWLLLEAAAAGWLEAGQHAS